MTNIAVVNFNSGELTPEADARKDIEKYVGGCRRCENMIPDIYGNATKRPGTEFVASEYDVMAGRYPNTVVADGPEAVVLDEDYQKLYILDNEGSSWTGIRGVDIDKNGNFAIGPTANNVNQPMVVLYDPDGTELYRDYPHPHTTGGNINTVRFSKDSTYVIVWSGYGLQKWTVHDRVLALAEPMWLPFAKGCAPHPTNDEYIVCSTGPSALGHPTRARPSIIDGNGNAVLQWSDFGDFSRPVGAPFASSWRIVCSNTHAFFAVYKTGFTFPILYKMSLTDADDVTYFNPAPSDATTDGASIYLYGNYIYFLSQGTTDANLWKLNQLDLSVAESTTINSNAISIWIDNQGRLGVKWHNAYVGHTQHIDLYNSDDLSHIESIDAGELFVGANFPYDVHNIPSFIRPTWRS